MRYLYITEDGIVTQKEHVNEEEVAQEDIDNIDQGVLEIFRFEGTRGFCRALVGPSEDDEEVLAISDWEMVPNK